MIQSVTQASRLPLPSQKPPSSGVHFSSQVALLALPPEVRWFWGPNMYPLGPLELQRDGRAATLERGKAAGTASDRLIRATDSIADRSQFHRESRVPISSR